MVMALEHDERVRRLLQIAPLRVGAGDMDFQRPEPRRCRIENEGNRIGDEPLRAVADEETEDALSYQCVQLGQILVAVKQGFVQGGLATTLCGPCALECQGQVSAHSLGHQSPRSLKPA